MQKKTTLKLSLYVFGLSLVSIVISFTVIIAAVGLGSYSSTSSSTSKASSSTSKASSSHTLTSEKAASSSSSSAKSSSASSAARKKTTDINKSLNKIGLLSSGEGRALLGVLCILISGIPIYSAAWREGRRDPNRVNYGHMKKFMQKGLIAGLIATVPNAVLTILFIVTHGSISRSLFGSVINVIYRIVNIQLVVFGDRYLNIPIICIAFLLIVPIISCVGYLAGWHNIALIRRIIYKKNKT